MTVSGKGPLADKLVPDHIVQSCSVLISLDRSCSSELESEPGKTSRFTYKIHILIRK